MATPAPSPAETQTLLTALQSGAFVMIPLIACSAASVFVIAERVLRFRKLHADARAFQVQALERLLKGDAGHLGELCRQFPELPTSRVIAVGLERLESKNLQLRSRWREAMERARQLHNQELRSKLWILGTIGSAAPFIGLFGTVIGILRSFQDMARAGAGGFAVVAAGISESLIATAAGIVVAVVSVLAFNTLQTWLSAELLRMRVQIEEIAEVLGGTEASSER